jgi:uracil-DNA glycosylase family 4
MSAEERLAEVARTVTGCARCPRLVAWREEVAARGNDPGGYWARPLPGFGDPRARLCVVGLAPAAHGANRTGRVFTGDRSGTFLFAALWRAGFANQPESTSIEDGLTLTDAFVTAAVRCAPPENRPTPDERDTCAGYLAAEIAALDQARVLLALGAFAWDAILRILPPGSGGVRPRFSHGGTARLASGHLLVGAYHPSQRNVFTGRLTEAMFDAVLDDVRSVGFLGER